MSQLDDSWRPDRSQILVTFEVQDIPPGYSTPGIRFQLIGSLQVIKWRPLVVMIGGAVERRIPVFLAVSGEPGHTCSKTFLNDALAETVASGDYNRAVGILVGALESCLKHPKARIELDD